jgi:hypothetical protein
MRDSFEQDLSRAFLAADETRRDLVEPVLLRAERRQARRRAVVTLAALAGMALTLAMIAASGLLTGRGGALLAWVSAWLDQPLTILALGAVLLTAAASPSLLRDI